MASHLPVTANSGWARFMAASLKAPFSVGAVAPTSRSTASCMAQAAGVSASRAVVELGAGTGVVTREILAQMQEGTRVLAIERNAECAAVLPKNIPGLQVIVGCASELPRHAGEHGFYEVDCILCTLPWSLIPDKQQTLILENSKRLLAEGGRFLTLVCYGLHWTPAGRHFHRRLNSVFSTVQTGPLLLKNFPPVIYYHCSP